MPHGYGDGMLASWALGVSSPQTRAIAEQRVAIVRGAAAQTLANPLYGPLHPYVDGSWQDLVVVPLDTLGRNFGSLTAYYEAGYPIEDDLAVLQAIGDLAATAVENARLLATAEHAAATLERQRLARELHDSVSQALFSMTLHARTAQRLLGH
jgi:signal transduction histidine kinase